MVLVALDEAADAPLDAVAAALSERLVAAGAWDRALEAWRACGNAEAGAGPTASSDF